mmetsp:Transcript_553/g.906  ORF Transcript_553/g.906 Transcript_553/m.906 type:complete len:343 (-) Transcript_553:223-1251(-)
MSIFLLVTLVAIAITNVTSFIPSPISSLSSNKLHTNPKLQPLFLSTSDEPTTTTTTTSSFYALDPESSEAKSITSSLGVTPAQHELLIDLSHLVVEWNDRLNLISRKDCTVNVVFGRHVLPSVALLPLLLKLEGKEKKKVVDVGTGGGFPGLPLAILFPSVEFTLVDSVGKKLRAVSDMADELSLTNVQTHHGRAELMVDESASLHYQQYDVCVGRSVAALPKFCFWVQDLLNPDDGKLVYIIGGEVEEVVTLRLEDDVPLDSLIGDGASDKRALILTASSVKEVAKESGEKKQRVGVPGTKRKSNSKRKNREARGGWVKRDNAEKKQRGYDDFKRFDSGTF